MPIDLQAKNNLVINVSNLVRHSHVKADIQRLSLAFRVILDDVEDGPIPLEPLFQYMVAELALVEKDALELCIVIASRKDKLGFAFELPLKVQNLSTEAVEHIVGVHQEKRTITGSWDKKEPDKKPAEKKPAEKGWEPSKATAKKGPRPSRQRELLAGLAVFAVIAVVVNGWLSATAAPPIEAVPPPPGGLPCLEVITNGKVAICTIPGEAFKSMAKETLGAKALLTKSGLRSLGVKEVWVKTAENRRVVFVQE